MRTVPALIASALFLLPAAARASDRLAIEGYLRPVYELTYRPNAIPLDEYTTGMIGSEAGVSMYGSPLDKFSYDVFLIFGVNGPAITNSSGGVSVSVEEAAVAYHPNGNWDLKVGQMRIPFTVDHMSPNTVLMFPNRAPPNEAFLAGTDLGVLGTFHLSDDLLRVSAGIFNGNELDPVPPSQVRGILYAMRADLTFFGRPFPMVQGDFERGALRLGVGAGLLYHPYYVYDATGANPQRNDDLRFTGSLRAAVAGLYLQGEIYHQQALNQKLNLLTVSDGAYLQAGFYLPIGVEPIARFGYVDLDETNNPRYSNFPEVGINFYPHPQANKPWTLKLSLLYQGENDVTQNDIAHALVFSILYLW